MRRFAITIVLSLCLVICNAQSTYNNRIDIGYANMVLSNIERIDSICYIIGIAVDSVDIKGTGVIFIRMDLNGEIIDTEFHGIPGFHLTAWESNMRFLEDTSLQFMGSIWTELPLRPWLVRLNRYGDILDSIVCTDVQGVTDNNNYMIGRNWFLDSIYTYITYGFLLNEKVGAVAIDRYKGTQVVEKKSITFGDNNWHESLLVIEDKWILGVRHLKIIPNPDGPDKRHYQVGLHSMDKNMNIKAEWISPPDSGYFAAYDLLRVQADDYIIATLRKDLSFKIGDFFIPWLLRVNTHTKDIIWNIDLSLSVPSFVNASTKVFFNTDTTAVYVAGQQFEIGIIDERPQQVHGFLAKVTMDGQLQWVRRYLGTVGSKFPDHKIFDAELLPDGSIIMVGESTDLFVDEPPGQRGWILRVDSFGCLVPGCQELNNIHNFESMNLDVRLYPNPVKSGDQLALFIGNENVIGELKIKLMDLIGILQYENKSMHIGSSTYLLDIPGQLSGMYLLHIELENHSWTGQILIVR